MLFGSGAGAGAESVAGAGWRSHRGSNIIKMQKLMSKGTAMATAATTCELCG